MDIQLPGKDGFALLGEIRRSEHRALRVLALTAHAMSGDRERALEAGFDGYITKPIDIRGFPEQVQARARGERRPTDVVRGLHDRRTMPTIDTAIRGSPHGLAREEGVARGIRHRPQDPGGGAGGRAVAEAEARRRRRGASRLLMGVAATVLIVGQRAISYVERPDWVFPAPPPPESLAVREASLRIAMANAAQHVERFRQQNGQLPRVAGAGGRARGMGITLRAARRDGYRLDGEDGPECGSRTTRASRSPASWATASRSSPGDRR